MKKLLLVGLLIGISFAGNQNIRVGNTLGKVSYGQAYYNLEITGTLAPTSSALLWYGDCIGGASSIMALGMQVSTGSVPTTLNAQAMLSNGTAVSVAAQVITIGTSFTAISAPYYAFALPAYSVTRNVTLNFLIRN